MSEQAFWDEFNRLRHHIDDALALNGGTQTIEDVTKRLIDGSFQMWTAADAVVITELCQLPRKSLLNIALGGGALEEIKALVESVEKEAKRQGLMGVMIIGRRGWGKVLPGYKDVATLHMKEF